MKKGFIFAFVFTALMSVQAFAGDVSFTVNGREWKTSNEIEVVNDRIMIDAEDFAHIFAGRLSGIGDSMRVSFGNEGLVMYDNSNEAEIGFGDYRKDYSAITLISKPYKTDDGRFVMPLRDGVEALLNGEVVWDNDNKVADIRLPYNEEFAHNKLETENNIAKVLVKANLFEYEFTDIEDIKAVMQNYDALLRHNVYVCRCIPDDIYFKITFDDGSFKEYVFESIYEYETVIDSIIKAAEH